MFLQFEINTSLLDDFTPLPVGRYAVWLYEYHYDDAILPHLGLQHPAASLH